MGYTHGSSSSSLNNSHSGNLGICNMSNYAEHEVNGSTEKPENEVYRERKQEQYRWQTTSAKYWDQVLDHEDKRIISLEDNHNRHLYRYIEMCDKGDHHLTLYKDLVAVRHSLFLLSH